MILEGLVGGVLRLAPEIMKQWDRANERKHELAMFNLQIEADKTKGQIALAQADSQMQVAEIQAVIEATKAQAVVTGIKWVDAINVLVRPILTLWWALVLYTAALSARFYLILQAGLSTPQAFLHVWGDAESSLVMMMVSFYFVGRVYDKHKGN